MKYLSLDEIKLLLVALTLKLFVSTNTFIYVSPAMFSRTVHDELVIDNNKIQPFLSVLQTDTGTSLFGFILLFLLMVLVGEPAVSNVCFP